MHRAYIGLGANLGDPLAALRDAARRIGALAQVRVVGVSSVWRSAPVEASGPDFYNAVLAVDTMLEAPALLQALHAIEAAHGRERPYRNAPRTLDLDVLMVDDAMLVLPEITLPHPRMHLRRFVLAPLLEIDPACVVPGHGPARDLLAGIDDQACVPTAEALLTD